MPVPQVKVGPDGSIIVDDSSTLIETTAAKKAKEDLLKTQLVSGVESINFYDKSSTPVFTLSPFSTDF